MANSADSDPDQLQKPTDLDLHCLQRQGISGFSRTKVNLIHIQSTVQYSYIPKIWHPTFHTNFRQTLFPGKCMKNIFSHLLLFQCSNLKVEKIDSLDMATEMRHNLGC